MIKIDKNNFEEINTKEEFYIHDSIIHELRFDYQQKSIDFLIEPEVENGEIKHIIFENVIGMEMITADLWGKSPHVFDFYSEKFHKRQLIPKIFRKMHELKRSWGIFTSNCAGRLYRVSDCRNLWGSVQNCLRILVMGIKLFDAFAKLIYLHENDFMYGNRM